MNVDLDHIVLAVNDVEVSLAFYLDVLGLAPYRVADWRAGRVLFPSVRLNPSSLIDLFPPELWRGDAALGTTHENLNHYCLTIPSSEWPALLQRIEDAGVAFDAGPMTLHGARGDAEAYYLKDPDGIQLEVRHYGRPYVASS